MRFAAILSALFVGPPISIGIQKVAHIADKLIRFTGKEQSAPDSMRYGWMVLIKYQEYVLQAKSVNS